MAELLSEHGFEIWTNLSSLVLAHITWRSLPDEHKHNIRRAVCRTKHSKVVRTVKITRHK